MLVMIGNPFQSPDVQPQCGFLPICQTPARSVLKSGRFPVNTNIPAVMGTNIRGSSKRDNQWFEDVNNCWR